MLKRLLLIWIFSGSLDSFSQVKQDTATPKFQGFWNCWGIPSYSDSTEMISKFIQSDRTGPTDSMPENIRKWLQTARPRVWYIDRSKMVITDTLIRPTPDTLRALMLISLSHKFHGTAHARMGYVVIQPGKETIYLDCFKRRYKKPTKGWMYEVISKND